jgi:hypothetical protein
MTEIAVAHPNLIGAMNRNGLSGTPAYVRHLRAAAVVVRTKADRLGTAAVVEPPDPLERGEPVSSGRGEGAARRGCKPQKSGTIRRPASAPHDLPDDLPAPG